MEKLKQYNRLLKVISDPNVQIHTCIQELKDQYNIAGVRDFIINRLYKFNDSQTMFYLPQLCYLYVSQPTDAISKFLRDKCKASLCLYFCIVWNVKSYAFEIMQKDRSRKEQINNFLIECENNIDKDSQPDMRKSEKMILEQSIDMFNQPNPLREHNSELNKTINVLTDFSLHLKKNGDESNRKDMGRDFLKQLNFWLWNRKLKK